MNKLQLGIKAHQSGQLQQAQHYYSEHLLLAPNDPDARQLLGLVYSALGDTNNAIVNMQKSLSINPAQPHVLNNLGVCQKKKRLFSDAKAGFVQAISLQPDYLDAHKNLVRLLLDTGHHDQAKLAIKKALSLFPNDIAIAKLNADYNQSIEDYLTSIHLYQAILNVQPGSVLIKHSLALSYRMAGQPARALELYDELEQNGLAQFQFFHNKANALSDMGQLQEAIEYYRKAISVNPAYVESHVNLNELLWETENNTDFLKSYVDAFAQVPSSSELRFSYVSTLLRLSKFQEALEFLELSPKDFRDHHEYFDLLGRALRGIGNESQAIAAQKIANQFDSATVSVAFNFAETLLQAGQYEQAEEVLEAALKTEPENKYGWALLGLAWRARAEPKEALLNDYENLVREYSIEIPDGFDSVEQFCELLNNYLTTLHTGNRQPLEQTLMGGTQTRGDLFNDPNPLIQSLVSKIKLCIVDYIQRVEPLDGSLPVLNSSKDFHFSGSWSVRLRGQGFHTQHVHPMGWLSSAFYVQLPPSIKNEESREGWLKLGEPNIHLPTSMTAQRYIKPAVGKLVLFQSYMWHGTIPFKSDQSRTSIAFDVAPGLG